MAALDNVVELLRRMDWWKRVEAAPDRIDGLEKRVAVLEKRLERAPGEACPRAGHFLSRRPLDQAKAGHGADPSHEMPGLRLRRPKDDSAEVPWCASPSWRPVLSLLAKGLGRREAITSGVGEAPWPRRREDAVKGRRRPLPRRAARNAEEFHGKGRRRRPDRWRAQPRRRVRRRGSRRRYPRARGGVKTRGIRIRHRAHAATSCSRGARRMGSMGALKGSMSRAKARMASRAAKSSRSMLATACVASCRNGAPCGKP